MLYLFIILLLLRFTEADLGVAVDLGILQTQLSLNASILPGLSSQTDDRWSNYNQPLTNTVISVGTEEDVAVIVAACYANQTLGCSVLAQSGGHGWSSSIKISLLGIIIDMKPLKWFTPYPNNTASIGGGIITKELVESANKSGVMVTTGNCDTVGYMGQALGGGYGNMATSRNLGHFQFVSMNIVLSNGTFMQGVTAANNPDLWFAMRGAGPNFGIVTSAVVKTYPITGNSNMAYLAQLYYNESQLEQVITAMNKTSINQPGAAYVFFTQNTILAQQFLVFLYYYGNQAGANSTFKYLLDVGPVKINGTGMFDWTSWNQFSDLVGTPGGQKPSWGANMRYLNPAVWRSIYTGFKDLVTNSYYNNDFNQSFVLLEQYYVPGLWGPQSPSYSFPVSQTRFISTITPWYSNTGYTSNATTFGNYSRSQLRQYSGINPYIQYINYAFGDEPNEMIYGSSYQQLRKLKTQFDRNNFYNAWFDIPPA